MKERIETLSESKPMTLKDYKRSLELLEKGEKISDVLTGGEGVLDDEARWNTIIGNGIVQYKPAEGESQAEIDDIRDRFRKIYKESMTEEIKGPEAPEQKASKQEQYLSKDEVESELEVDGLEKEKVVQRLKEEAKELRMGRLSFHNPEKHIKFKVGLIKGAVEYGYVTWEDLGFNEERLNQWAESQQ